MLMKCFVLLLNDVKWLFVVFRVLMILFDYFVSVLVLMRDFVNDLCVMFEDSVKYCNLWLMLMLVRVLFDVCLLYVCLLVLNRCNLNCCLLLFMLWRNLVSVSLEIFLLMMVMCFVGWVLCIVLFVCGVMSEWIWIFFIFFIRNVLL